MIGFGRKEKRGKSWKHSKFLSVTLELIGEEVSIHSSSNLKKRSR